MVVNKNGINSVVLVDYITPKTNLLNDRYYNLYNNQNNLENISEESRTIYCFGEIIYYIFTGINYNSSITVNQLFKNRATNNCLCKTVQDKYMLLLFMNIIHNYENLNINDLSDCIFFFNYIMFRFKSVIK